MDTDAERMGKMPVLRFFLPRMGHRWTPMQSARAGCPCYVDKSVLFRLGVMLVLVGMMGGCAGAGAEWDAGLAERLGEVLNRGAKAGVVCAARVVELPSGREIYAQEAERAVMPASNQKLLVAAAALDRFGADYTFKTYLAFDGRNLWVIGTGDPATGDPRIAAKSGGSTLTMFEQWAAAIRGRGITRIAGDLYYYDGLLDDQWVHPAWDRSFLADWYAAPVAGLNFNDNCIDVAVSPAARGQVARCEIVPRVQYTRVINGCVSGEVHGPTVTRTGDGSSIALGGTCAKAAKLDSVAVGNPGLFFADALRTYLADRGIRVEGQIRRAARPIGDRMAPPGNMLVAVHETPIGDVLWRMNKFSQNLFAEAMIKVLGRQRELDEGRNVRGSWEMGGKAVRGFLQRYGVDDSQVVIEDGSGLGRGNRATARVITGVLEMMFTHPAVEVYRSSLAVPGEAGTLSRRMSGLGGCVMAKTGTLRGACSLSGYVRTRGGRWVCFSILYNGYVGDETLYRNLQDEACRVMAEWGMNGAAD